MAARHRQRLEAFPKTDSFVDTLEALVPRYVADFSATPTAISLSSNSPENFPRTASEFCS